VDISDDRHHKVYQIEPGASDEDRIYPDLYSFTKMVKSFLEDNMGIAEVKGDLLVR
jgi:hypothetical protein